MRWKVKPKTVVLEGDQRTRKVFAFMPKNCKDGLVRWLEFVIVNETYTSIRHPRFVSSKIFILRWIVDSYDGIEWESHED